MLSSIHRHKSPRFAPMASRTSKLLGYKLDSDFDDDGSTVVHTTYGTGSESAAPVFTTWRREERLGAGAFGVVWRQREEITGQLRAVKVVSKLQLNIRELEALVELQDVGFRTIRGGEMF